jgi:HK97 family phage prohead protease
MNITSLTLAYKTLGLTDVKTEDVSGFNGITSNFSAYLSTWSEDQVGDIVAPGAYDNTLKAAYARRAANDGVFLWPILYQHDAAAPIGGILDAHADNKGLKIQGYIDPDIRLGAAVLSGLHKQYLTSMSIGYRTISSSKGKGGVRILEEIELYEGSIVTFAANAQCLVIPGSVKSFKGIDDILYNMKDETTMATLKAYKKYYTSDIAETLQVDRNLVNYLIDKGMKNGSIRAKQLQNDYVLEGSEVAILAKLYIGELKADRLEHEKPMSISVKLSYPEYAEKNTQLFDLLPDATSEDLKMNKELDDRAYSHK